MRYPSRIFKPVLFYFAIVSVALLSIRTQAAYPLGNEVVLYHFEDAATATSTNSGSGGTAYDGTFVGSASTSASVRRFGSRSAVFGEANDYMKTYYASGTNPTTQSISVSMWVYKNEASAGCNSGDDDHFFGSSGQPSGSRFYLRCTGGVWGSRFGAATASNSATAISHQTWQHIVLVFDAANDTPKLYVDNVLKSTSALVSSYTITQPFFVGSMNDTITNPGVLNAAEGSNASIDETAIYNVALSAGDIAALYNAGDGVAPVISSVATSSVSTSSVTISWTTDENASTQIEYGTTISYGATTTETDNTSFITSHTQTLTGLAPNTTYNYRVVSRDPSGTMASSSNGTFTTSGLPDVTAPVITSIASSTTATTATITWNTDELSTSTVNYGLTASYGSASTSASLVTSPHTIVLSGLTQNTLYHFKVSSSDASGNLATSSDLTFTTSVSLPGQPTALAVTGYEGRAYLTWTAATGTVTDYQIESRLTSGGSFAIFSDGVSTGTSTIVTGLTNATSYDFKVTALNGSATGTASAIVAGTPMIRVSFLSPTPAQSSLVIGHSFTASASSTLPSASYASSTHILRLETSGGSLVSQVSTTTRFGDYNLSHLTNTLANSDLSLTGNSSGIAYVPSTDTLFIVHNSGVGTDATIDEIDKNGTLIRTITCTSCGDIEGITLISTVASSSVGGYDHTFMISTENNLSSAEIFRVLIHSTGTTAVNRLDYFNTGITHNSNNGLEGIAYNSSTGVYYVARELTTPALYEVTLGSGHSASATQICSGLSLDAGVSDFSDLFYKNNVLYVLSENTNPSKLVPINISSTSSCSVFDTNGDSSGNVSDYLSSLAVGATDQAEGVTFDVTGDTLYVLGEADYLAKYRTNVFTTQHTFSGLANGSYVLKSSFVDTNGITSSSTDRAFIVSDDVTPPAISSIASSTASATATITWSTDEVASSSISYGLTTSYGSIASSSGSTSHSVSLAGLDPSTLYHYRVFAVDPYGNMSTSSDATFTTSALPDTTAPGISSIASSTDSTTASVTWSTDEVASSSVSYGLTASYGSIGASAGTVSHTASLSGLSSNTLYHFQIAAEDTAGNLSTSSDQTFTTTVVTTTTTSVTVTGWNSPTGGGGDSSGASPSPSVAPVSNVPGCPAELVCVPNTTTAIVVTPTISSVSISKPLRKGVNDKEIILLQKILNLDPATRVSLSGPGSQGKETSLYGLATDAALKRFQLKYKVVPSTKSVGYGILGPATRAMLSSVAKVALKNGTLK